LGEIWEEGLPVSGREGSLVAKAKCAFETRILGTPRARICHADRGKEGRYVRTRGEERQEEVLHFKRERREKRRGERTKGERSSGLGVGIFFCVMIIFPRNM